ncbi:leucine-rich repeat receptor-like protein kinase TDR [Amborella trichopoda]|uniref:Protein kinase domain-containing protein n=1 Tax=Amborella trichopoda TaxID=13333 RepID=W1PK37_AMBTC|nr:leucine-rich repeat receptor-like protein kinase TDR [Amborella trichopoda]ERN10347.1 hypothetical protein AMTR_s00026p00066510 [Amborella trichopoda]|eukprot:XP_006848766.1 leucine-rich repeat receptor-like protein kinase TDR [Amborella trichopoda]
MEEKRKSFSFPLVLALLSLLSCSFGDAVVMDRCSKALLGLKSQFLDSSNSLSDWSVSFHRKPPTSIAACSWTGIRCNDNSTQIIGLNLSFKNLSGTISGNYIELLPDLVDLNLSHNSFSAQLPASILNLPNLKTLDISRNNFSGHFPSKLSKSQHLVVLDAFSNSFSGPLPPDIAHLDSLQVLNLAGSYFQGSIPPEYGSFRCLQFLHLAGNFLSGEIPAELGKLITVTHMEIGYNFFNGSIPWQLGNMSELQYLDIADARLSGSIPEQLSNLTKLEYLFLFRNELSGVIPSTLGNISSLMFIDLSDNLLSGPIPESFTGLKNLRLLSLMYNQMSGHVPEGIAELPYLESLLIWNNFFTGNLPPSLGRNSELKWLDVSTNGFTGQIPEGLCERGKLYKLILFSNGFTGGFPSSLANCSALVRLRIAGNNISGEIPLKFSILPSLNYVDLSRNNLEGEVPGDLSQAPDLEYFNVSYNPNLKGTIPANIWSSQVLKNFSAAFCNISGKLPQFRSCGSVSVIELNGNRLSGDIPESIANCKRLETLALRDNELTGLIPRELANLHFINVVDLSHNELSGSIPRELSNCTNLVLFNVSFNHLSGSVPSTGMFRLMDTSAFAGNPWLCGGPLQPCLKSPRNPEASGLNLRNKTSEKATWTVLLTIGLVFFIIISSFGIFFFNRRRAQWKMIVFSGLPQFKKDDVLKSLSYGNCVETGLPQQAPAPVCKADLPTGITVAVKKVEWGPGNRTRMTEFINRLGHARHRNLIRLLGFCSNNKTALLLYDYLPNGSLAERMKMKRDPAISTWTDNFRVVIGIARGLCYLHHDCYPAIPHGDLRASNVLFDETMEPHLAEFGLNRLLHMNGGRHAGGFSQTNFIITVTGKLETATEEDIYRDIYNFGRLSLEILTNGRTIDNTSIQNRPEDEVLKEIYNENQGTITDKVAKEEVRHVLEVALQCTSRIPSDRPSMEEVLKKLSGLRPTQKKLVG